MPKKITKVKKVIKQKKMEKVVETTEKRGWCKGEHRDNE